MVRNKQELVRAASAWMETAKADIARHTDAFMRRTDATVEQLANILDVDTDTIMGMLDGTIDIPMSVFAKILIATNNVIVITPAEQMSGMRGGMQTAPRHATANRRPARDAQGRFTSTSTRRPMPPMPPMPMQGFPMPDPDGMLPPPEDFFEMAGVPNIANENEEPTVAEENTHGVGGDEFDELADALRQNPEVARLLHQILDR